VVRVFRDDDIIHVNGKVDPKSDIEVINSELILADIETLEKRILSNAKKARTDKEAQVAQTSYETVLQKLNEGILAIEAIPEDEQAFYDDLHLLTNKKFVYAANVSEDMMDTSEDELKNILGLSGKKVKVVPICAKLEADMIEMSQEERDAFLSEMGLITTGLDNLIKASYDALELMYYFTAGEQEVRAWTIPVGAKAPQAA
jgi:hypothetical protein